MKHISFLVVISILLIGILAWAQAPALDDLGTALTNHGMDSTTAGPAAAAIEIAISNNNALLARISADETNISNNATQGTANAANLSAVQTAESNDAASIQTQGNTLASLQAQQATQGNLLTALQASETTDAANIITLNTSAASVQTAEGVDAANITTLQGQVTALSPASITAIQTQLATIQSQLATVLAEAPLTPVSILQQPTSQTVTAGGTAKFTMQLSSGACRSVIATVPGPNAYGPLGDNTGTYIYSIPAVTAAMNGKTFQFQIYGCTQPGAVNSNTVTLTVH